MAELYLRSFRLPDRDDEADYWSGFGKWSDRKSLMTCYDCRYPFGVFTDRTLPEFEFAPITVFYGGNGSGKSTVLNLIAEKLRLGHTTVYNRSDYFDSYVKMCRCSAGTVPAGSRIIASDDVFDRMFSVRSANFTAEAQHGSLGDSYTDMRREEEHYQLRSLDEIGVLKDHIDAWSDTRSKFIRKRAQRMLEEHSNGETALEFFCQEIGEGGLYLLDEPENSLSAALQLELRSFISDSVRFFKCQFVIATHSPFLLALDGARIYDLDCNPVCVRKWTQLENVRIFHDFFAEHSGDFD